jgi:hypothetical protein
MLSFIDHLIEGHPENPRVKYDYYKSIKKYTHPAKSDSSKGGGSGSGSGGTGGGGGGSGSGSGGGGE